MAKSKTNLSNSQLALQAEIAAFKASWQGATDSLIRTAGFFIECGEALLRIKDVTNPGEFMALFTGMTHGKMGTGTLPCSYYHAARLIQIGKQPLIRKHQAAMPGSLHALVQLAQLAVHSADAFESHVKAGAIHPHMTERDARKLMGKPAHNAQKTKDQVGRVVFAEPDADSKAKEQFIEDHDNVDRASFAIRALENIPGMIEGATNKQIQAVIAAHKRLGKQLAAMLRAKVKAGKKAGGKKAA